MYVVRSSWDRERQHDGLPLPPLSFSSLSTKNVARGESSLLYTFSATTTRPWSEAAPSLLKAGSRTSYQHLFFEAGKQQRFMQNLYKWYCKWIIQLGSEAFNQRHAKLVRHNYLFAFYQISNLFPLSYWEQGSSNVGFGKVDVFDRPAVPQNSCWCFHVTYLHDEEQRQQASLFRLRRTKATGFQCRGGRERLETHILRKFEKFLGKGWQQAAKNLASNCRLPTSAFSFLSVSVLCLPWFSLINLSASL